MTCHPRRWARVLVFSFVFSQTVGATALALADHRTRRAGRTVVVTRARPCPAPGTLGTFQPTPYITVRGNSPLGGGYSPLDIYGDQTLSLYGPLSPLRVTTAPVLIYTRGYDGSIRITEAASFSTPNLPELSPVIYPTEANNYYAPRINRPPPRGSSVINWIDQN
jgi:hypothetical protein